MSQTTSIDYLKVLCKIDNRNLEEVLEEQNKIKTLARPTIRSSYLNVHASNKLLSPKLTYDWTDRLQAVWMVFKNLRYSNYNPFDFRNYKDFYSQMGEKRISTPWKRLKSFLKHQLHDLWFAINYTPDHIVHYNQNKPRIDWFENKIEDIFFIDFDKKVKDKTLAEFREKGYRAEKNAIWYEPVPTDKDRRLI